MAITTQETLIQRTDLLVNNKNSRFSSTGAITENNHKSDSQNL